MKIKCPLLLLSCLLYLTLPAQEKKALTIEGLSSEIKIDHAKFVSNLQTAQKEAEKVLQQLYDLSFLSASVDSITEKKEEFIFHLYQGKTYQWIKLSKGNLSELEASKIDLSSRLFLNRPFRPKQLTKLFERTINYFENNGYPFAAVSLDSIEFKENGGLSAALHVNRNTFYKIDSILVKGKSKIKEVFLFQHLDLFPGEPYNEEKIRNISTRIDEIPFVEESRKTETQYFKEGVKIIIHLKKKDASRFDGILGLLSNEDDGSIELTGDVDLNLINSFNRGERIGFNWRKLKGNSQDLNLSLLYPYLFNSPFGLDFNFKLFKRDTTFLDLETRVGINYNLNKGELISIFVSNKTSSLLSRNTLVAQANSTLPALGDVSINSFGVTYGLSRLDYQFNPRKGIAVKTSFSVGRKKIKKITALEEEFPNIYDGVNLNSTQFEGKLNIDYYFPLGKRSTIKIANQSAGIYAENIFQNELLRIGGLKVLRGFDEESITASTYSIFTLEYRFLLDRNSYFSLFSDAGYYENENVENEISDTPLGLGVGINFETNAGIFSFNYAVGKQFDNPIEFRAAKIHFGFINLF